MAVAVAAAGRSLLVRHALNRPPCGPAQMDSGLFADANHRRDRAIVSVPPSTSTCNRIALPTTYGTAVSATDADDKAVLADLMAAQQKTSEDLAELDHALAGQREQLATIMDRLAEMSSKIEAVQNAVVAPHITPPVVAAQPVPAAAQTAPAIARPVPSAPPPASKPKRPT